MGLKSVTEQSYCVVTQDLLVGTALGERTAKNSCQWQIKRNSEKSQVGCRWELVFAVWLVKSALEMWKGEGEEACGCAQTHTAFPERVTGIKAFPCSAQTVAELNISQCTHKVQHAEYLKRVQLQEGNTERGCTFKKNDSKYFWYFSQNICESFYMRVEWQMINYHTYLSPQGCSQSLEKKKNNMGPERKYESIPERSVTINISMWNTAILGKMFKFRRQRENPQFSIKPNASVTTLHSRTPTARCYCALFSLLIKYILYILHWKYDKSNPLVAVRRSPGFL